MIANISKIKTRIMDENKLKNIISKFVKLPPESITEETIIDNSVLKGSILFHRMISRVNDLYDIQIENYNQIHTYKDLLKSINEIHD